MAVSLVEQPLIKSVYRPMLWRFRSSLYPVTGLAFNATELRRPTANEVNTYAALSADDVVIVHPPLNTSIYAGERWAISTTQNNLYTNRVVRVLTSISATLTAVSVEYLGDDYDLSVAQQGNNFTLYAELKPTALQEAVRVALRPIKIGNEYLFELDVRDILARSYRPITDIAKTETSQLQVGDEYISMDYSLYVYEAYDVVSADNVITFTEFKESGAALRAADWSYNIAHPYHQVERDGEVVLDYQSISGTAALNNYEMLDAGDTSQRYLTFASRTAQRVRSDDNFFLSFIHPGRYRRFVEVKYYNASGNYISQQQVGNRFGDILSGRTWIINVGPNVLSIPGGTSYYTAQVAVDIGGGIIAYYSELMRLNLVSCKGVNKRWYYLNKMGGVDQFTFEGDETRSTSVKRSMVSKSSMHTMTRNEYNDNGYTFRGDWNRKVWETDVERRYTLTSGYLSAVDLRRASEDMFESPHVFTSIRAPWWTTVLILTGEAPADSNTSRPQRLVLQYTLGVDDVTQRR